MKKLGVGIIVIFMLAGMASLLFCGGIKKAYVDADGATYFSYLPAVFVNHDLSFKTLWDSDFRQCLNGGGSEIIEKDGKYLNSYTVGVAILELPFFIVAHIITLLSGGVFEANGYSLIYQIAIIISQFFYVAAGLLCINSLVKNRYGNKISIITLITICFGTNLMYYMVYGKSMSHAFSFCLISLFLFLCDKVWNKDSFKWHVLIGVVLGLITMCRVPNILVVFIYIFGELTIVQIRKTWKGIIRERLKYYLVAFLSFLVTFAVQMAYWYYAFGMLIGNPYSEGSTFSWLMPHIYNVFLSFYRGLLIWHPIYILGFIGLIFIGLDKNLDKKRLGVVLAVVSCCWVISAWDCWWYGTSFGQRSFVDILPVLSLCMASFFNSIKNSKFFIVCTAFLVLILCIHNLDFYYAYNLGNFPISDDLDYYNASYFTQNYLKENIGKINNNKLLMLDVGETKKVDVNAIQNNCIIMDTEGNMVSDGYMNMLYGPYSKIKKGKYKFKIELETVHEITENKAIAEVSAGSVAGNFFEAVIMSDCLRCEFIFEVENDIEMAEIWVTAYDFGVIFKNYEITRLE